MSFYDYYEPLICELTGDDGRCRYEGAYELEYEPDKRCFFDPNGVRIINILEYLTPNDLVLFFAHPDIYNCFPHRDNINIMVKIATILEGDYQNEQNYNPYCSFYSWGHCQFSSDEESVRKEVCSNCGGRNC